ncbi:MAG: hypothetical protein IKI93_11825 [Clostridia bacterium]|nr:hypothetical protein [Clostridia bacterium]
MPTFTFGPEDLLEWGIHPLIVILLLPAVILLTLLCVRMYYSRRKFTCTECSLTFRPKFTQTHIGLHEENGRDQFCPRCRKITFCRYVDDNHDNS